METEPNKVLQCKGHPDVRHVGCGGQLAISGEGYRQLPTGFGFGEAGTKDQGKFVIDVVRYPTYGGFCLKCRAEGDFVRIDKKGKKVRTRPRSINRKLQYGN